MPVIQPAAASVQEEASGGDRGSCRRGEVERHSGIQDWERLGEEGGMGGEGGGGRRGGGAGGRWEDAGVIGPMEVQMSLLPASLAGQGKGHIHTYT